MLQNMYVAPSPFTVKMSPGHNLRGTTKNSFVFRSDTLTFSLSLERCLRD